MKDFIEKKWLKLIPAIAISIASISVAYYFFIFLPSYNQQTLRSAQQLNTPQATTTTPTGTSPSAQELAQAQRDLTKNQSDCKNMMQDIGNNYGSNASDQFYTVKNHYNISLQKCFVEFDQFLVSSGTTMSVVEIFDAVENTVVARCMTYSPPGETSYLCGRQIMANFNPAIDRFSTLQEMKDKYMKN